jgi:hypothetical protein
MLTTEPQEVRSPNEPSEASGSSETAGWVILLLLLTAFLVLTVYLNLREQHEQQFSFLAQSFLHGDLAFQEAPGGSWADASPSGDRYYWPLGPLPAILLMPLELLASALGAFFCQGYLQPFLVAGVLWLVYRIAQITGFRREDAAYLAFGFTFATAFLGVALWPWSWYFSQVITCLLLFAAIREMIGQRRPWVLGILFALVLATRATAILGVIWCLGEVLNTQTSGTKKLKAFAGMAVPILIVLALMLSYNHARFGNPFDQGYAEQIIPPHAAAGRAVGILSPQHIPGNLYTLLWAGPNSVRRDNVSLVLAFPYVVANPWGMSIWVTSPLFLYLFGLRYRDQTSRLLWLTVIVVAVPVLLYYGIGFRQFGYRYSLDFLPFLYYLLIRNYRQQRGDLSLGFKTIVVLSSLFNLYLFAGHFVWGVGW